jgi:hypothetical protein
MADITMDRERWLGYRWHQHGLDRADPDVLDDLLLLGFQGSRQGGAQQSLIQRGATLGAASIATAIRPGGPLLSLWSVRGAPHAHSADGLDFIRDALAPQESDEGGTAFVEAVDQVARALGEVVTGPTTKSEASTAVTRRVSASLVSWCARCKAHHVPDGLFRAAGRQAQLVLGPDEERGTVLHPAPHWRQKRFADPRRELLNAYLRVNGPTTKTLFRDWRDGGTQAIAELWKELGDSLIRVQIGHQRYQLPEALLDAVVASSPPRGVVLVPPNDPYLRQVDRTLLVPDKGRRQEIWRALSGPGALLIDGEVAGTWRWRRSDRELTITPFTELTAAQRKKAGHSAARIAEAVGDEPPKVTFSSP